MLALINHINEHDNNLLYDIFNNTSENAGFIWNQMKTFMTHEEQVKYLTTKRCGGENIMQRTNHNCNPYEIRTWMENVLREYGLPIPRHSPNLW